MKDGRRARACSSSSAPGQALPELDAALMEKSAGDELDVEVHVPGAAPASGLPRARSGEVPRHGDGHEGAHPARARRRVREGRGQFQTLVELRADIHTRLEKMLKDASETALAEQIVDKLNERTRVDVPPSLVEQQCRDDGAELSMQARRGWASGSRRSSSRPSTTSIHADAEKKVRAGLLMAAIARKQRDQGHRGGHREGHPGAGRRDAARTSPRSRAEYRDPQKREMLIGMILEDKVLDLIEGKAKITEGDGRESPSRSARGAASEGSEATSRSPRRGEARRRPKKTRRRTSREVEVDASAEATRK